MTINDSNYKTQDEDSCQEAAIGQLISKIIYY